jgi:hypothetical protein
MIRYVAWTVLCAGLIEPVQAAEPAPTSADFFQKKVAPILVGRCLECHSGSDPKGELDLTSREALLKGGESGKVVRLKHSDESSLFELVADGSMPPKKKLSIAEIATLKKWIDDGLPWPGGRLVSGSLTTDTRAGFDWWSLQPLRKVAAPAQFKKLGVIDAFIANGLKKASLTPSKSVSREGFIRRLTYALHGLPPTPRETTEFVNDTRPRAVERLIDRLLASPRYGERMARHWLDLVIRAFNEDMPYDRFVSEQLAGDMLNPDDKNAGIPTGFVVAGGFDEVARGTIMKAEARQDELEDMIGVTTQAFLGLSAQCSRCHEHKFDPIPQEDYYRIQAVFAGAWHTVQKKVNKKDRLNGFYGILSKDVVSVRLLKRGSVLTPGHEVTPGVLSAIKSLSADLSVSKEDSEGQRRVKLAEWIIDERNALPSRVIVNRVWGWMFGRGIVATPSDFGFNGARPSHPELLDRLAADFVSDGRSIKRLIKRLVLSNAFRRGGEYSQAAAAVDGDNQLLWRFSTRRLQAEEVRDSILAVSGRLGLKQGGPSFPLFEWTNNAGTLYRPVDKDTPETRRRSVYRMVVRGAEDPVLTSFDCPDPSIPVARRQTTTTALQALSLLNNTFVVREAGEFAKRLEREAKTADERIRLSYRLAFGRLPSDREATQANTFVTKHGLTAWCRVLFNANEFLYVN